MGRVVAIGGGELNTTHSINKYIVELTGKKNANFLFIGTASHDAEGYISAIRTEFESLGCVVRALCLTTTTYKDEEIDSILNQADIIYVGLDPGIATVIVLIVVRIGNTSSWMGCWNYIHIVFVHTIMKKDEKLLI